jgi:hypothetical protein
MLAKLTAFGALSCADYLITRRVVLNSDCESNPIARAVLFHTGWTGLASFKIAVTIGVMIMLLVARKYQHKLGKRGALIAAAIVGAVVSYSSIILFAL